MNQATGGPQADKNNRGSSLTLVSADEICLSFKLLQMG